MLNPKKYALKKTKSFPLRKVKASSVQCTYIRITLHLFARSMKKQSLTKIGVAFLIFKKNTGKDIHGDSFAESKGKLYAMCTHSCFIPFTCSINRETIFFEYWSYFFLKIYKMRKDKTIRFRVSLKEKA